MNLQSIIVVLYFALIIVATFLGVRKHNKAMSAGGDFSSETFKGGGRVGSIALAILVSAGAVSTGTFIACLGKSAAYGPGYLLMLLYIVPLTHCVLITTGKRMTIVGSRINANSLFDIFKQRYDNSKFVMVLSIVCAVVFALSSAAGEFVGGSRVIEYSAGIPYRVSLIAFAVVIVLYTALGGMTGVTVVGIIQGFIMLFGSLILLFGYMTYFGSVGNIFSRLAEIDPVLLTPNTGGTTPFILLFEYWVMYALTCGGLPWVVQGSLTYDNTKTMKRAMIIGTVMLLFWNIFFACLGGAAARAFDPALDETMIDYATSTLAMEMLPAGLAGIVLAAAAGAGQSTIGAIFIFVASTMINSVYKSYRPNASNQQLKKATIITTICMGIVIVLVAFTEPATLHILLNFAQGGCACSILPALYMGLYWPRTTKQGAAVGMVFGIISYCINYSFDFGFAALHNAPMLFTFPITIVLMVIVSLATEKPSKEVVQTFYCEVK